jgi:SAM-dependent methyltransferase
MIVMDFVPQIVDVACGYGFTALAANTREKYKVFGCGINADSQIGKFIIYIPYLFHNETV